MTEASSFSSLLALVDSHLSKTSIQGCRSEVGGDGLGQRLKIPTLNGTQNGTKSETLLSFGTGQRLAIPTLNPSECSIQNVLAEQVANMLKAKELKRQQEEEQEKQRLAEEMEKLRLENEDDYMIDLTQAMQVPCAARLPPPKEEVISRSNSFESLCKPKLVESVEINEPLPCITDMSYILKQKIRRSRGSPFGRVLSSRLRPVAAPYLREKIESNIVRFDFSTKSPCDLVKEKLRKPVSYNTLNAHKSVLLSMV